MAPIRIALPFSWLFLFATSLALSSSAMAQSPVRPRSGAWDTRFENYTVPVTPADALEWRGDLVVVSGSYSDVIQSTRDLWTWDGSSWSSIQGPFAEVDTDSVRLSGGSLWRMDRLRDELVVAATRTNWARAGSAPPYYLAVGTWNGRRWESLGGDVPGFLYDIAVVGDDVYLVGSFVISRQERETRVMRWTGTAWESIVGVGAELERECFVDGDDLLVSGTVTTLDGRTLNGLCAWNGTDWRQIGPSLGPVTAVTRWRGDLIVGTRSRETGVPILHRWDGTSWEPFASGLPGRGDARFFWSRVVTDLRVEGNTLRITGLFDLPDEDPTARIATWDGTRWTRDDDGIDYGEITVAGFTSWRGRTLIYGAFTYANGRHVRGLAQETKDGWRELRRSDRLVGSAWDLRVRDDRLWVFGDIWAAGGARMNGPVTWDGARWEEILPGNTHGEPIDLVDVRGSTFAVGDFHVRTDETGDPLPAWEYAPVATFSGDIITPLTDVDWPDYDHVDHAVVWRDRIAIATTVYPDEGRSYQRLILWDGVDFEIVDLGSDEAIHTMASYDDRLYVGGRFFRFAGQRAFMLTAYDGVEWTPVGGDVGGEVHVLDVVDDALVVGGHFNVVGDTIQARSIARWDGSTWSPIGTGFFLDAVPDFGPRIALVEAITVHGGDLIATGTFDRAGDVPVSGLARWDGESWSAVAAGSEDSDLRYRRGVALASYDDDLYVSGFFARDGVSGSLEFNRWIEFSPRAARRGIELDSIAPNPMNPGTSIRFTLTQPGPVRIDLYDVRGRHVRRLIEASLDSGEHQARWDGTDDQGRGVASGVYFVRVRSSAAEERGKVTLVR